MVDKLGKHALCLHKQYQASLVSSAVRLVHRRPTGHSQIAGIMSGSKDAEDAREAAPMAVNEQKPQKRAPQDAFSELMTRKKAKPETEKTGVLGRHARWRGQGQFQGPFQGRDALGAYIADPASAANKDAVVYYSDDFVAVHDKFPKAAVHCLLLPRTPVDSDSDSDSEQHPLLLFNRCATDAAVGALLERTKQEAAKLARSVAADLQRRFGQYSASDSARQAALRGGSGGSDGSDQSDTSELPAGRDWTKEVLVGVHARPSMGHLHVHVLSRDMHSDKMRHRKHYNSFTTPFFVRLDEFPLAEDDPRLAGIAGMADKTTSKEIDYLRDDLRCWRCGRNFGNRFAELKRHLDVEFEAWKKE